MTVFKAGDVIQFKNPQPPDLSQGNGKRAGEKATVQEVGPHTVTLEGSHPDGFYFRRFELVKVKAAVGDWLIPKEGHSFCGSPQLDGSAHEVKSLDKDGDPVFQFDFDDKDSDTGWEASMFRRATDDEIKAAEEDWVTQTRVPIVGFSEFNYPGTHRVLRRLSSKSIQLIGQSDPELKLDSTRFCKATIEEIAAAKALNIPGDGTMNLPSKPQVHADEPLEQSGDDGHKALVEESLREHENEIGQLKSSIKVALARGTDAHDRINGTRELLKSFNKDLSAVQVEARKISPFVEIDLKNLLTRVHALENPPVAPTPELPPMLYHRFTGERFIRVKDSSNVGASTYAREQGKKDASPIFDAMLSPGRPTNLLTQIEADRAVLQAKARMASWGLVLATAVSAALCLV